MEQEPGKAGEPVPAAPHPDDVPTFEPKIGSENALENGAAHGEPAPAVPVEATPASAPLAAIQPEGASSFPAAPAAAPESFEPAPRPAFEAAPPHFGELDEFAFPAPDAPHENAAGFAEAGGAPAAVASPEATDAALRTEAQEGTYPKPDAVAAAPVDVAVPDFGAPVPPAGAETTFAPLTSPPPAVVSAWGPPPPPWPPAATGDPTGIPAVTAGVPLTGAAPGNAAPAPVEEPYLETGPNWMLAFVCLWAAGTALNESWFLAQQVGLTAALIRNVTVMGYGVLGLGLAGFAIDALQSGKKQPPAVTILNALIPALLTLAGVILLVLSNDPGRRI